MLVIGECGFHDAENDPVSEIVGQAHIPERTESAYDFVRMIVSVFRQDIISFAVPFLNESLIGELAEYAQRNDGADIVSIAHLAD